MPKTKRYELALYFKSKEDLEEWAKGVTKRPYCVRARDALHDHCDKGQFLTKRFTVKSFLDQDRPLEKDLHPLAQGLRISRAD